MKGFGWFDGLEGLKPWFQTIKPSKPSNLPNHQTFQTIKPSKLLKI
jgi:hypothetical protein